MSFFEQLKGSLSELPISDILRARLDFAFDQITAIEKENANLHAERARLEVRLEETDKRFDRLKREFDELKSAHEEEHRVVGGIDMRRGLRTGGQWLPFCPVCKSPAAHDPQLDAFTCTNRECPWMTIEDISTIFSKIRALPQ
jgi:hypothetical protein